MGGCTDLGVAQCSWVYEKAVILYNLAALHVQAGMLTLRRKMRLEFIHDAGIKVDRTDAEGCKASGVSLKTAMTILTYLRDNVASHILGTTPDELRAEALQTVSVWSAWLAEAG